MKRIAIIGGGSWGSALAMVLADNGNDVTMYMRNSETAAEINEYHTNSRYLQDVKLNSEIIATTNIADVSDCEIVVFAVPTQNIRSVLNENSGIFNEHAIFVNVAKGIEIGTNKRISEIFSEFFDENRFVALSGPTHAEEVAIKMPTAIVAASLSDNAMSTVQDVFMNKDFRVYTNEDVIGVELGGATKNILALGLGIADGLGFGDNTKAAIMTRGMHEIARLGIALGGRPETFYGLTGMGDLIVTSTSMHSRNRRAGILIGQGQSIEETEKKVNMVVEGIKTCKAVKSLIEENDVEMPITEEIYNILFNDYSISDSVERLMERNKKREVLY